MESLIGKHYRELESIIEWKLLFEDMYLVILKPRTDKGQDVNLVGISTGDLTVKWELGGVIDHSSSYDGVVNIWVKEGQIHVGIWSGYDQTIDYKTGRVIEERFTK